MAKSLAVDGNVTQAKRLSQGVNPVLKAGLKGLRIESVEDTLQRIVGGDAMWKSEKGTQPRLSALGKSNDLLPVISTGEDAAEGDGDDVDQEVKFAVSAPRVAQPGEEPGDGKSRHGHASSP